MPGMSGTFPQHYETAFYHASAQDIDTWLQQSVCHVNARRLLQIPNTISGLSNSALSHVLE